MRGGLQIGQKYRIARKGHHPQERCGRNQRGGQNQHRTGETEGGATQSIEKAEADSFCSAAQHPAEQRCNQICDYQNG